MVQFHKKQGSQKMEFSNKGTVSQNVGIAAYKKWDSQNNGTVSQNAGITA